MKTNDNDEGMLIIFHKIDDNGLVKYRIRGSGPVYNKFYTFLRGVSYVSDAEDFPWDYFHIDVYADEVQMINKFGKYMAVEPA